MKVIVIVGPTGIGKTSLSIALAKYFDTEIISGDSMQIYKGMSIGTAKVTIEEMDGIIHHLIDMKDPRESYSVQEYQSIVRYKMNEIYSKNKIPVIVGGTGLYIKSVLYDYVFTESTSNHDEYKEKYKDYTNDMLYEYLLSIDEESALKIHKNNRQRVLRAIEIYESTGQKKSDIENQQSHTCLYDAYIIGLTTDRETLYQRINQRVNMMIDSGLEEEVYHLYQHHLFGETSSKAIGYKEWFPYFKHECSKEDVIESIKKNSRNYAKRQYTWFNNQMNVHWYDVNINHFDDTIQKVIKDIKLWES